MSIDFKETQRFNQWYLWVFLIALGLFPIVGIYQQIILGQPFGSKPMSDVGLIVLAVLMAAFLLFMWMIKLETLIDEQAISINFFPFFKKRINWSDLASAEVLNYGFVGGWGIRLGTKFGTVYNVKGKTGLAIVLKSGKRYCIGTQQEEEMKRVIALATRNA